MIYIHNVPGRVRIKNDVLKRNPDSADEIRKALSTISGICTVDINLTTGSILVHYNSRMTNGGEIAGLLESRGLFDYSKAVTNDEYFRQKISKIVEPLLMAATGALV